jgi:AcrR family transcriptional regulator
MATAMRKAPKQARSRATVEFIIQAAARVLGRQGWARFTTNEVAEAAGVSVGSLYQYFPNKHALVDAIMQRHFDAVLAVLRGVDASRHGSSRKAEELVRGMIAVHQIDPALHRVLLEEMPSRGKLKAIHDEFKVESLRRYQALIAASTKRRESACDEIAAQVLSAAVKGVIHDATINGTLELQTLKDELMDLVSGFLLKRKGKSARLVEHSRVAPTLQSA